MVASEPNNELSISTPVSVSPVLRNVQPTAFSQRPWLEGKVFVQDGGKVTMLPEAFAPTE